MLTDPFGDIRFASAQRLDQLCRQFEKGWQSGDRPCLETYLTKAPEWERCALLEELLYLEFEVRHKARESLHLEDYLHRFPSDSTLVKQVWRQSEFTGAAAPAQPKRIGRYRIEKVLGKGGFGIVYLAQDEQLTRLVAVKTPHARLISRPENAELYLAEARIVANLDHPNIVPVFDVGSAEDCPCYVVSKYIEGCDLATKVKKNRPGYFEAAKLAATVAEALDYAHHQGLVHRDVKPGNILIGSDGSPHLVDFGLALREESIGKEPKYLGTPAYMSPEQARGEGHRVERRSDIFSLGVVFYELLVGRRPFLGETQVELREQITSCEAQPLRQVDQKLPKELERICNKTLAKRASERYSTAHDLADDLRRFLSEQTVIQSATTVIRQVSSGPVASAATHLSTAAGLAASLSPSTVSSSLLTSRLINVTPKGLRCFDAGDADFFLDLLPGPRDREGLPDRLRFWKRQIEQTDPDVTFSTGLIYGPSGCGKSSLVRAGLLPLLSEDVISIYVEATAEETETRLLNGLHKRCPAVKDIPSLKETLTALRQGQGVPVGAKVLIVLDQFEQWLHAKKKEATTELSQALRQCDGGRIQCIVLVRDDFWMGVTRFLRELEVPLLDDHNVAAVDLFPEHHARKVLVAFGRAFGALPHEPGATSKAQQHFLAQSVSGLAEDGKVICVRLALFAEMVKNRPWTPATLKEVGGAKGVGATFLEENFSSSSASPKHRRHQRAARAVLKALLPESGVDIKGQMKSYQELVEASAHAVRPQEFDDLIRILDGELRLITPTEPEGVESDDDSVPDRVAGRKYYQLTHDYLAPSLREWLNRKQKETRRGRAELRLEEQASLWNAHPETRYLPSALGYLRIALLTERRQRTPEQQKMMTHARRVHMWRGAVVLALLIALMAGGLAVNQQLREQRSHDQARLLTSSLDIAELNEAQGVIRKLAPLRRWAMPLLAQRTQDVKVGNSTAKLHAWLARVSLGDMPKSAEDLDYLEQKLLAAEPAEVAVMARLLLPCAALHERMWNNLQAPSTPGGRLRAACFLALASTNDSRWPDNTKLLADDLARVSPVELAFWVDNLLPASDFFVDRLRMLYEGYEGNEPRQQLAEALARYLRGDSAVLVKLILQARDDAEFGPLLRALRARPDEAKTQLHSLLSDKLPGEPPAQEGKLSILTNLPRQALCVCTLFQLGDAAPLWPRLRHSADPTLRSHLIYYLRRLGDVYAPLIERLETERDVSIRRAIILVVGGRERSRYGSDDLNRLLTELERLVRDDPDPGIHSAASWSLRQFGLAGEPIFGGARVASQPQPKDGKGWFFNSQGQLMVVVRGFPDATSPTSRRDLAISAYEVRVDEFLKFHPQHEVTKEVAPTIACPVHFITWYAAAAYCNWLSAQENLRPCFEPNPNGKIAAGMSIPTDCRERDGYRLPTAAEWEYACRALSTTAYSFGSRPELIVDHGWKGTGSRPVGGFMPNEFGLFDMHGNVREWCLNGERGLNGQLTNEERRIARGGAFYYRVVNMLATAVQWSSPTTADSGNGFRIVRTLPPAAVSQ